MPFTSHVDSFVLSYLAIFEVGLPELIEDTATLPVQLTPEEADAVTTVWGGFVYGVPEKIEQAFQESTTELSTPLDPKTVAIAAQGSLYFLHTALRTSKHNVKTALLAQQIQEEDRAEALDKGVDRGLSHMATIAETEANSTIFALTAELAAVNSVKRYEWVTQGDSRVRRKHRRRNGQTYNFSTAPSDGHPGMSVNCRCHARPL